MNTKDVNSPFQPWLAKEMDKRGWDAAELARRSGVNQSAIGQVISEKRALGAKLASAIAKALDMPESIVFQLAGLTQQEEGGPTLTENELMYIFRTLDDEDQKLLMSQARAIQRHRRRADASS